MNINILVICNKTIWHFQEKERTKPNVFTVFTAPELSSGIYSRSWGTLNYTVGTIKLVRGCDWSWAHAKRRQRKVEDLRGWRKELLTRCRLVITQMIWNSDVHKKTLKVKSVEFFFYLYIGSYLRQYAPAVSLQSPSARPAVLVWPPRK